MARRMTDMDDDLKGREFFWNGEAARHRAPGWVNDLPVEAEPP